MHIPPSSTNYEDLIQNALWVVVDAWAQQPHADVEMMNKIQLNQYNHVFLCRLKEDITKTYIYRDDEIVQIGVKHVVNFMQSADAVIDPMFEEYVHVDNIEDLVSYILDRSYTNIVLCGLHYGKCVTTAATMLSDAMTIKQEGKPQMLPDRKLFIKRDMCCLWPNDEVSMHDRLYKQMDLELI